jgi:hypothetical protein
MTRRAKLNKRLHSQAGIFIVALAFLKSSYRHQNGMGFFCFYTFAVNERDRFQTMWRQVKAVAGGFINRKLLK